jgi:hypothetical protein
MLSVTEIFTPVEMPNAVEFTLRAPSRACFRRLEILVNGHLKSVCVPEQDKFNIIRCQTGSPPLHRVHLATPSETKTFYIVPAALAALAALAASTFDSIPQNLFIKWNRYATSYTVLPAVRDCDHLLYSSHRDSLQVRQPAKM